MPCARAMDRAGRRRAPTARACPSPFRGRNCCRAAATGNSAIWCTGCLALRRITSVSAAATRRVIGLAGIEYTVLIAVAHLSQDGDVNVKSVADHLYLTGAFITAVAGRLLRRGLIHKETDSQDRRRVRLTVSAKGRAALERLAPMQRQVNDVEFGCLNRQEFELLTGLVDRLIDSGARAVALQNYLLSERAAP